MSIVFAFAAPEFPKVHAAALLKQLVSLSGLQKIDIRIDPCVEVRFGSGTRNTAVLSMGRVAALNLNRDGTCNLAELHECCSTVYLPKKFKKSWNDLPIDVSRPAKVLSSWLRRDVHATGFFIYRDERTGVYFGVFCIIDISLCASIIRKIKNPW